MLALATTLALVASRAAPAPATAPVDARARSIAAPAAAVAGPPPAAPAETPPAKWPRAPVVPTQALLDKLGQGDRMFLSGDYRSALFTYQDAVYMQPGYAPARVRLGRAYLALRYPAQAIAQAEAALAEDPDSAEAKELLEEAQNPPERPAPGAIPPAAPGGTPPPPAAPRVYRLTPEPDPQSASTAASSAPPIRVAKAGSPAVAPRTAADRMVAVATAGAPAIVSSEAPPPVRAPEPVVAAAGEASAPGASPEQAKAAAEHYRTAIGHLRSREWAKADAELSAAIAADPRLAVAHSARGSARFGLGMYRGAAEDYRSAIALDAALATPVYGLAECYRVLGDAKQAAELYDRYARSEAPDVREDLRTIAEKRARELR